MKYFNIENWPIVHLKIIVNEINDETFEEYKKNYLELLVKAKRENKKILFIPDMRYITNVESFPMNFLMKQMQFNKDCYKFNKEHVMCVCILSNGKILKNILNVYFKMVKQACPFKICSSTEKATIFFKEKYNIQFDVSIFNENNTETTSNKGIEEEDDESEGKEINELDKKYRENVQKHLSEFVDSKNDEDDNNDNENNNSSSSSIKI
jgi:hypothetical protein